MKAYLIGNEIINLEELQRVFGVSNNLYFYFKGRADPIVAYCNNPAEEIKKIYNLMVSD